MILVAAALLAIALATLWPASGTSHQWLLCVVCGNRGTADLLLNSALFMPLGAALALRGQPRRRIVLFAALLSSAIELSQFVIPGRDPTPGDVVANTLGAALGALLVNHARAWLFPTTTRASRLCRGATSAATLICLATGLLLTPSFPPSRYYGLRTPQLGHLDTYKGRVLDAVLDGTPIAAGPLPARFRDLLQSREGYEVRVRAVAGPPPDRLAPLVAIFDDRQREILLLGFHRGDLVLRERTRAADWRLDRPDMRVPAPQTVRRGDTMTVSVVARAGRYSLNGVERGFTVGIGWALLAYLETLPFSDALSAAWIGALFVPAGFWWRTRWDGVIVAIGLLGGLMLVPALTPLVLTPLVQWAAAGVGVALGLVLSARGDPSARSSRMPRITASP